MAAAIMALVRRQNSTEAGRRIFFFSRRMFTVYPLRALVNT